MKGLIHIYTGEGKGKTTAALGLAVRASGCGKKVLLVQFFKGRDSGELHTIALLPNITVLRLEKRHGFFKYMNEAQKREVCEAHTDLLSKACELVRDGTCELLILDEAISAYQHNALDKEKLEAFVQNKPDALELVLTGRNAPKIFIDIADYVTEMRKVKHPYEKGIPAREGIEF